MLMLAIAFLWPALLSWLALAALPIIIHLLSRRQFRRVEWAATRFLLDAEKQNRRRVRFEQWLLVALRCLAIALLVFLVARPFIRPSLVSSLLGGRGEVRRVIVLDDSASLSYRGGAAPDFATLRDSAERLMDWLRQEGARESISVFVTSQPEKPLVESGKSGEGGGDDWRPRLRALRPTDAAARPVRVLGTIARAIGEARTPTELYLFSDFQRSDWLTAGAAGQPQQAAFERLRNVADNLRVVLISSGSAARENVGIENLSLERPQALAGVPTIVTARVANHTRRSLRDVRLDIEVDGSPQPGGTIDALEPGDARETGIEVTLPEEGRREVLARLASGDGLAADDVRRIAANVKSSLNVLIVNGQPSSDPLKDEAQLPRNALAPPGPFSSGIKVEVIDSAELETVELRNFDCVLLCNVPPLSETVGAMLRRFVQTGGGVAFFLGDEVGDGADFNRVFYADGAGPLPAAIAGGPVRAAAATGVGLLRVGEHPVTAAFPSGQDNLSEYVHFRSYYPVADGAGPGGATQPTSQPGAVVLAKYSDEAGTAALLERRIGRGRALLFTSTIDLDWNDWARAVDGSYVVTLLELVQYIGRRAEDQGAIVAGEVVRAVVAAEEFEPRVTIRTPAYPDEAAIEARLVESAAGDEAARVDGPVALRAGTYRFQFTRRIGGTVDLPVCVNVDAAESDLAVATAGELDAALGPISHEYLPAADAFGREQEPSRRELWPTILTIVVIVLMAEQVLAWWFGRPLGGGSRGRERFVTAAMVGR
jgi:hypothetical protein